jgi:hypothetical protein
VVADISAKQDFVAGTGAICGELRGAIDESDAGGSNENLVALATVHDLGVAGDQLHACILRGQRHGIGNARQFRCGHAFFQDESCGQIKRLRSPDSEIVDRPVYRERADVATREKDRRDHEGVGAKGKARPGNLEDRLIVHPVECGIAEAADEDLFNQLRGQLTAAAMAQHNLRMVEDGKRAFPEGPQSRDRFLVVFHFACAHRRSPPMATRSASFRCRP